MKTYQASLSVIVLLAFLSNFIHAQPPKYTISGYVREDPSQELLIGVNVYSPQLNTGTVTNTYGFYSLTLPTGDSVKIIISFVGYIPQEMYLRLDRNIELNVLLKAGIELGEVTVTAQQNKKESEDVKMSAISIPVSQIKDIPSLLGEKDVLKVLQLMPGVQKGTEGSSGFYVRGGGPDQNLIILDDAIVYNVSHLFGFFSLFNGDALKSVELTKGGFPARYGGRLSSVLEMNMKEGNKQEWHGEGGIGLISTRMTVEGPLVKNKSSILVSGRRTYFDVLMAPFLTKSDDKGGYFFYDFNAKINYDFGRRNKLYLSGYFGRDKFYEKNKSTDLKVNAGFYWGNATGTLRWNHLFNDRLFANTSLIYSEFKFDIYEKYHDVLENKNTYGEYYSAIQDFTFKYDLDFIPNPKHWIKTGFNSIYHHYQPHAFVDEDYTNEQFTHDYQSTHGIESSVYLEDTYQPVHMLKLNIGSRVSNFIADKRNYFNFEPRLSVAWRWERDIAWKASYAEMNQYIHLLSNTGIDLPTDLWVPATDRVKPQHSSQVAAGFVKDFTKQNYSLSIEGYYKIMKNIIGYKEGASFATIGNDPETGNEITWEDNVTSGKGWSKGIEVLLQRKTGKLSGWIGYTLSWTQLQFDSLNFGRKFYARYDRRHDVSVVGIYRISPGITFSGTWVYGTGNAITMPTSRYSVVDYSQSGYNPGNPQSPTYWTRDVNDYGGKNNSRMGAYHRLDLGIQFHKAKKHMERTWELSAYNVYNRHNPFFYYTETVYKDGKEFNQLKQISLFPFIPTITYSFKF